MVESPPREQRLVTLKLDGYGRLGEALSEIDGKPAFVIGGISGETVLAEVLREHRGYVAAQVVDVLETSPHRIEPPCEYFGACTGCQWQHVDYAHQLDMKRDHVVETLARVGGIDGVEVRATLASPQQLGYRNHARFTIGGGGRRSGKRRARRRDARPSEDAPALAVIRGRDGALPPGGLEHRPGEGSATSASPSAGDGARKDRMGFVHRETHRHVDIDRCLLMAPWINETLAALQGDVGETTQLSLRYGVNTGDWLLQPTLQNPEISLVSGQKHYTEAMRGHTFRVSSPSFFQVNTPQAEQMADIVMDALAPGGTETIADAYAGVGTFAVLLADRARHVVAVEESASALADARLNIDGLPNVQLRQARTEDVLRELAEAGLDGVVLDPPRSGCMPGTLDALLDAPPKRIVYVSCEPETLARDLAVLTAGQFRLEWVQPVDMFPQTHHVECVAFLTLDDARLEAMAARGHLVLASASPRRREILDRLGLGSEAVATGVPEPSVDDVDPVELARERAISKARAGAEGRASGTAIGSDTVVELDGRVLGKPADEPEARAMLEALRGREHRVITAIAFVDAATGDASDAYRASRVAMRDYTDAEIDAYIATGDPMDKAGAYAVQHVDFAPAAAVKGCYLNVVGLPVCTLLKQARRFGLRLEPSVRGSWPELDRCPECAAEARGGRR